MEGFTPSKLVLKDGSEFHGFSPSLQKGSIVGEIVFTTSSVGYVETITDPSFAGQIVVFSYPLIGNYGFLNDRSWESLKSFVKGVVISDLCLYSSHREQKQTLLEFLKEHKIPLITSVDTRALVKHIRSIGPEVGAIVSEKTQENNFSFDMDSVLRPLFRKKIENINPKEKLKVIVVDCGLKNNILRALSRYPIHLKVVPPSYDFTEEEYDGVVVTNGPGDPHFWKTTIVNIKKGLHDKKPYMGICLGLQLLGLAIGAMTYKMKFGHRGINQPCQSTISKRCLLTSQNHGYALLDDSIPEEFEVLYRNLNDNSIEGIYHKEDPFFAVQFHPESCPGPKEAGFLFNNFYKLLQRKKMCPELF